MKHLRGVSHVLRHQIIKKIYKIFKNKFIFRNQLKTKRWETKLKAFSMKYQQTRIAMVLQTFIYFLNVFCIIGNDFSTRSSRSFSFHTVAGYPAICSREAFILTRGWSWCKVEVNCFWLHIHLMWISNLIQFKASFFYYIVGS